MKIKIYQIDADLDKNRVKFLDYEGTIMTAGKIDPKIYKTVYSGDVSTTNLEDVFAIFNIAPPKNYNAPSMSVSDIVEISECPIGKEGCYFCDNVDWKKLDDFDTSLTKPMDGLRVVMIEPGKQAYETFVRNNLESFQKIVEGDIERTYPFDDYVAIIGNEEAKLIGMPGNRRINGGIYAGPIFIVGINETGYGYTDLTDEQTERYLKMFNTPDNITDEEVAKDVDCGVYIV